MKTETKDRCKTSGLRKNALYLTEREVAEITARSVYTLRAERFKGKGIPYVKIGRSVRYLFDDVLAFMEAHKVIPGQGAAS